MSSIRRSNNAYYGFLILFYLFLLKDWLERVVPFFGYADELIAAIAIPFCVVKLIRHHYRITVHKNGYWKYIVLFILLGLLGNVIFHYQPFVRAVLPDLFTCLKFWLAIETGKFLFQKTDLGLYSKRIFFHIKLVCWGCFLLLMADYAFHLFSVKIRFGLRSAQLFYSTPMIFAANIAFLMALLLLFYEKLGKNVLPYFILISLMGCLTLRIKMIGAVAVFWLFWYLIYLRKKRITIRSLLLFIPVLLIIGWSQIEFYFFSEITPDSARYQMLVKSVLIANDHFPIGSGLGTFGSYFSGVCYSPLYHRYGLSHVWGLTEAQHHFLNDSFWPMVLGQTGWIGLLCMLAALYKLYRQIQALKNKRLGLYAGCIFSLVYLLLDSFSSSSLVHPSSIPFALFIGYCFSHADRKA